MAIPRIIFPLVLSVLLAPCGWARVVEAPAAGKPDAAAANATNPRKGNHSPVPSRPKHGPPAKQSATSRDSSRVSVVSWQTVAELPAVAGQTTPGLAGVFAGALDDAHAVVAGGTFYEGKGPLEGGQRTFSDALMVLAQSPGAAGAVPTYAWVATPVKLPRPLAYGASVSLGDGVLLVGGTDGAVCVPDVRLATWAADRQQLELVDFPLLPKPLAFLGAGRVGNWVVVVGGTTTPDGRSGADVFGLDLGRRADGSAFAWEALPALPAAVHFPIVVGELGDDGRALHVFGGRDLRPGQDGRVLSEGWKFDLAARTWTTSGLISPGSGVAPVPLMGGAAVALEEGRLLVLGGDDGQIARVLEENSRRGGTVEEKESYARLNAAMLAAHPGYRRDQLLYDSRHGKWHAAGHFPEPTPAVTPAFLWDGAIMLIGGEPAPGRRSARVWLGSLEAE